MRSTERVLHRALQLRTSWSSDGNGRMGSPSPGQAKRALLQPEPSPLRIGADQQPRAWQRASPFFRGDLLEHALSSIVWARSFFSFTRMIVRPAAVLAGFNPLWPDLN